MRMKKILVLCIGVLVFLSLASKSHVLASTFSYYKPITITPSDSLSSGYAISVQLDHASLVSAGKSLSSGNDIAVFYDATGTFSGSETEINRQLDPDSNWNSSSTTIWFKLQSALSSADSTHYRIYYGNTGYTALSGTVFDYLNSSVGTLTNTSFTSPDNYGPNKEIRVKMGTSDFDGQWSNDLSMGINQNKIGFYLYPASYAVYPYDNGCCGSTWASFASWQPTTHHKYVIRWFPDAVHLAVDASTKDLTGSYDYTYPFVINPKKDSSYDITATVDYILIRDAVKNEPSVTPGNEQSAAITAIATSPASATVTVGTPFMVAVQANGGGQAFNAAQATVTVSSNLAITGLTTPSSTTCGFTYTQAPTVSDPSFAGAIFGSSKTSCTVYKLTLTPTSSGTGTVTISNAKLKAYADSTDLNLSVQNASYTINTAATPTPTTTLTQLTVTSPTDTYNASFTLTGSKDAAITHVYINGSDSNATFPTNTTWQKSVTLSSGANQYILYGKDDSENQTATITVSVNLHTLGDINGDSIVDIIDFSLFAADWGKTSNLTNPLSDMNGDSAVDLTDYSNLAKLEE